MGSTSEPAERAVRAFVTTLGALRRELPAAARVRGIADLVRLGIARELPREGKLDTGVEYAVHGVGCRFTTTAGLEVDVDLDDNGTDTFDAWRLSNFADSDPGLGEPTLDELNVAARRLVAAGQLCEVRPGWYATTGSSPG